MNTRVKSLLVGAAVVSIGAMCVAHPGHPPIPTPTIIIAPKPESIPFELFRGSRILVPARINGHNTQVLLDTGASLTTLNRDYAKSIGLPEGFKVPARGAGGLTEAEMVTGLTLDVGGLRIANASVGVLDLAPIARSIGRPIAAIFGRDIFNAGIISIDWAKKRLVIRSHELFKPVAGAIPIELRRKGPFNTIAVSIAGGPAIDALFDLGNGGALVLPRSYWGGRPELMALRSAATEVGGVGGIHSARAAIVPKVTLAGTNLLAVPIVLSESGNDDDPTQMANVGVGLIKQFNVDLDLGRDRIYLTPRADKPLFDRDRAGVRFDLAGDRLKAAFVSPDGPAAAAGLKEGDEIVAVNGRRVTGAYYETGDWTRGQAGKRFQLTRADGSKVTVKLADYY